MRKYSVGVFLEVFDNNPTQWKKNLEFIKSLKHAEHIELLLEYLPSSNELDFFKKLQQEYTIIMHAPFMDLSLLSPHEEIVEASYKCLKKAYEIGILLGAKAFTIHAGQMPSFWKEEKAIDILKKRVIALKSNESLPVCIENMPERRSIQISFPSTVDNLKKIISFSKLNLDVGHFMKMGVDPVGVLEEFSQNIGDIHLHDSTKGKDHLALGEGELDIKNFLQMLEKKQYDKFVTLEVIGKTAISKSWKILQSYLQ